MAQVEGGGGGRSANIELNLVPFIDLMSVLITFLLITAVWSQVSMIQIGSSIYGKQNDKDTPPPPPPMADIPIRLDVKEAGFRLLVGKDEFKIDKVAGTYDVESLSRRLKEVKNTYQAKSDATITVDDTVMYEFLILGMDTLLKSGFPQISVATGGTE